MSRHLVAVGGSGQHVALAYLDLYALGLGVIPTLDPVQLYVLDRDRAAAWHETIKQLRRLRESAEKPQWAKELEIDAFDPTVETRKRVDEAVSSVYGPVHFNKKQLQVTFQKGYYGQAPVAAAFFGNVCQATVDRTDSALHSLTANKGRTVIAGSVIGGTGAGCLPRLTEFLGQDNPEVMATVLLNWFRLTDPAGANTASANERTVEMKSREPSALVYARERLSKSAATVLLGHPAQNAGERPWSGDTQQASFEDLTIPYYAAAAASRYHFGPQVISRGLYGVACPPIDSGLALPPGMVVFSGDDAPETPPAARLGHLVALNVDLCRRLGWATLYLANRPYLGPAWFKSEHGVPFLDQIAASRRGAVAAACASLLEAKWEALRRLAKSDPRIVAHGRTMLERETWEAGVRSQGIEGGLVTLASWFAASSVAAGSSVPDSGVAVAKVIADALTSTLHSLPAVKESTARVLPEQLSDMTAPSPLLPGKLEAMALPDTERYLAYDKVAPERLPTAHSMEFFLDRAFTGRLGSVDSPDLLRWKKRWRLLILGLAEGRFELSTAPRDEGAIRLMEETPEYLVTDGGRHVVGYVSRKTLVVPAVQADWERLEQEVTSSRLQGSMASIRGWSQFLLGLHGRAVPGPNLPGWLNALKQWSAQETEVPVLGSFGLHGKRLTVDWAGAPRGLLLPSKDVSSHARIGDLLRVSFDVSIEVINSNGKIPGYDADLLAALGTDRCPVYQPLGPGRHEQRRVVWDQGSMSRLADLLKFGVCLFSDGPGQVRAARVRDPQGAEVEVLHPDDVILQGVEMLDPDVAPDYPVQLRYAGLIDLDQPSAKEVQTGARNIRFEFSLKGLGIVEKTRAVRYSRTGAFMLWPKFKALGPTPETTYKAYYLMADSNLDHDEAWVLGRTCSKDDHLTWQVSCPAGPSAQPLYSVDASGQSVIGGVPELFTLKDDSGQGIGLFKLPLEQVKVADGGEESWGVDFGTSSSVVAVRGDNPDQACPFAPSAALDQTLVIARKLPKHLSSCQWFPTWDGERPRIESGRALFPSTLVLLNDQQKDPSLARYGVDYVIDHGGELNPAIKERLKSDLKWIEKSGGADVALPRTLRQRYLRHLLELCVSMRPSLQDTNSQVKKGLPSSIRAVFTMPIAMLKSDQPDHSPDLLLADDITRVCQTVSALVGRTISPAFMWESHAGTTPDHTRSPRDVYAVADLGGGSLDMWGAFGNVAEDPARALEFADSYRFGGHALLVQWVRCMQGGETSASLQRNLQTGTPANVALGQVEDRIREDIETVRSGYFSLATEACARWIAGIAANAAAVALDRDELTVHLRLLGMGWGLHQTALTSDDNYKEFVAYIGKRAGVLLSSSGGKGSKVRKVRLNVVPTGALAAGDQRKTFLARRAAAVQGKHIGDLHGRRPVTMFGFDVVAAPEPLRHLGWATPTNISLDIEGARLLIRFHEESRTDQPLPKLREHDLNPDELSRILDTLYRQNVGGAPLRFSGDSPIAIALDVLRHNTRPSPARSAS